MYFESGSFCMRTKRVEEEKGCVTQRNCVLRLSWTDGRCGDSERWWGTEEATYSSCARMWQVNGRQQLGLILTQGSKDPRGANRVGNFMARPG